MKLDASILLVLVATTASEETTPARLLEEESMSADLSLSFNAGFMGMTTPMTMCKSKLGKAVKDPICKLPFAKTTPLCSVCKDQKFHFYVDVFVGRFCDPGFSLVEEYYFDFGWLPAVPTAYNNVDDCCEDNDGFDDDGSYDLCLCDGLNPPDFCGAMVTAITARPIGKGGSGK
jgi:hypothetical protein